MCIFPSKIVNCCLNFFLEKDEAKSVITFSSYCSHFENTKTGEVQLKGTELCLVPLDGSVKNDAVVGLGKCDGKKDTLTFHLGGAPGMSLCSVQYSSNAIALKVFSKIYVLELKSSVCTTSQSLPSKG